MTLSCMLSQIEPILTKSSLKTQKNSEKKFFFFPLLPLAKVLENQVLLFIPFYLYEVKAFNKHNQSWNATTVEGLCFKVHSSSLNIKVLKMIRLNPTWISQLHTSLRIWALSGGPFLKKLRLVLWSRICYFIRVIDYGKSQCLSGHFPMLALAH